MEAWGRTFESRPDTAALRAGVSPARRSAALPPCPHVPMVIRPLECSSTVLSPGGSPHVRDVDDRAPADLFERVHDVRLVCASQKPERKTLDRRGARELGNRVL